jgi:hypothetical protein
MAATPSIKIETTSAYRTGTRVWSNRYHFNGGTPANSTAWETLRAAIVADQKTILPTDAHITGAVGYAAGSEVPVWSWSGSVAGTYAPGTGQRVPLEVCALIRYATTARSSKNHPVYLFNYVHDVYVVASSPWDNLLSGLQSGILDVANAWIAGYSDGTNTLVRAGPNGATAIGAEVPLLATHHDFPR